MKKNLNRTFGLAIITGMVILSLSACRKSVSPNTPPAVNFKNKAAYIYKNDSTNGHAYRGIMEPNNCGVVMVSENDCGTFDFSSFNMIVVDGNTAKSTSPWSTTLANQINNVGKPTLLMGEGGAKFGEALNLKVKWGNAGSAINQTGILVNNPSHDVFKSPKNISVTLNQNLVLYNTPGDSYPGALLYITDPSVDLVAQTSYSANYYEVTFEKSRYGYFGFDFGASNMTSVGKDFLVNFSFFVAKMTP